MSLTPNPKPLTQTQSEEGEVPNPVRGCAGACMLRIVPIGSDAIVQEQLGVCKLQTPLL